MRGTWPVTLPRNTGLSLEMSDERRPMAAQTTEAIN